MDLAKLKKQGHVTRFSNAPNPETDAMLAAGYYYDRPVDMISRIDDYYTLVYILEGGGEYIDDFNGARRVTQGNVLLIFPGSKHTCRRVDFTKWSECYIAFQGKFFSLLEKQQVIKRSKPVYSPGLTPALRALFDDLISDFLTNKIKNRAVATSRIHLLLSMVAQYDERRGGSRIDQFVRKSCKVLGEDLGKEITVGELASLFDRSPAQFEKDFKEFVGVPPRTFRINRKISAARGMLAEGLDPKVVARNLGYKSLAYFYEQFKQVIGKTTKAFATK